MNLSKISITIMLIIVSITSLVMLNGCFEVSDHYGYYDKASYNDVIPTVDNILELSVQNKDYTLNDLNLTKDEKRAIEYYQNNTVNFIDLSVARTEDYLTYNNEQYSISNYAYDIALIETFFGIDIDAQIIDNTSDVIEALNKGTADIITEFIYSDSRAEYINFVDEASVNRPKYYYSKNTENRNAFIDLLNLNEEDRNIGVDSDFRELSQSFIDSYGLQVKTYSSIDSAVDAIESGEIEGYISSSINPEYYSKYRASDISRYNVSKTYSVAYKNNDEKIEDLATAIHKLLNIDSRQSYNELKSKLLISNGDYLTNGEKDAIAYYKNNPLKVEMPVALFPESYLDDNGLWAGIAVDSFEYRAKLLGLNYEIVTTHDSTIDNIMNNIGANGGNATSDVVVGMWYTEERAKYIDFSEPLLDVNFVLVGRNDAPLVGSLDEISNLEIGITKNYGYVDIILDVAFSPDKEYIEFDEEMDLIDAYRNGEIDYFMVAERHLDVYKSQFQLYDADIKYSFDEKSYVTYGFSKNQYSADLVSALNKIGNFDTITRYVKNYDVTPNIEEIIGLENQLAVKNMVFIGIGGLFVILVGIIIVFNKKRQESRRDARTDQLTNVGNRRAFFEDFSNINLSDFKILFIDLTNFKTANDTYGHDFGDVILNKTAERLESISENSKTYRLGGDEFVVTIPIDEKVIIEEAIKEISTPIYVKNDKFSKLSAISGKDDQAYGYTLKFACGMIDLSKFDNFDNLDDILKYVDLAMYKAKESNSTNSSYFEVNDRFMQSFHTFEEIEHSVLIGDIKDLFCAVYQPLLDVKTNKIVGYEALVRYKKDLRLPPPQFLSILKRSGKLKDLDLFVLEESVKLLDELISTGLLPKDSKASSNLGALTISEIDVKDVDNIVSKYSITKDNIYLEISEESILSVDTLLNIYKLKDSGYQLAIDDFTAGNSSLSFLSELDVDIVKLDQQLLKANIDDFVDNDRHVIIYQSVTELSKKLGFKIISEGVETAKQLEILSKFNVDVAQGYYIAKPLQKQDLIDLIKKKNR